MKKLKIKKPLAVLLVLAMCLALLPATVSAQSAEDTQATVENIKIAEQGGSVQIGDRLPLTVEFSPETASDELEWSSSDPTVASVDGDGVVTGKGLGTATITAETARNDGTTAESTCTVTVTDDPYAVQVYIPKGLIAENGISFYPTEGFGTDNRDTFGEESAITAYTKDAQSDDQYDVYSMTLERGIYSFRAVDEKGNSLGGGAFRIPAEGGGGTYQSVDDTKIYLRLIESYVVNEYDGEKATAEDYSVRLMNKIGVATMGDPYINSAGYECYPTLAFVSGNALLYYNVFTPSKDYAVEHGVGATIWGNYAVQPEEGAATFGTKLNETSTFTINAPKGAEAALYTQVLNFNAERIDSVKTVDLGDGTVDHVFNITRSSNVTYRVSMEGMRTEAGFVGNVSGDRLEVNFDASRSPKELRTSGDAFSESSLLLNINERNKLELDIGEQYKVRAYRAAWQIIHTITDNIMVEPDFHYHVVSGEDIISIETMDGGNAGDNWAWVTAKKEGVAIVEVSYDALDVNDAGKGMWMTATSGFYGATDPIRTGVFVVTVGDQYKEISGVDWDAEYNVCYFLGDSGEMSIAPDGNDVTVSVASVLGGKISEWRQAPASGKSFRVPIEPGNNVICIEADGVTDYRVVRGSQLDVITNNNVEGRDEIYPGDTVSVSLRGLYMPIPKFSGIYNPGFPATTHVSYEWNGEEYSSGGIQYHIIEPEANLFKVEIPETASGAITLTGGKLSLTSMGSSYGKHRELTDVGVPANFNAASLRMKDTALPDITIQVSQPPEGWTPEQANETGDVSAAETVGTGKTHTTSYYPTAGLTFDLTEEETDGYVTVSFEDYGVRLDDADFKTPLGVIIAPTQVPYKTGDNIAEVTLRLLDALDIGYTNTGSLENAFYLAAIQNFKLSDGTQVDSFGEFDSGAGSGWMITLNNWYINSSTADFEVEDGDFIRWQNTCQVGADIGCDWSNGSAEITGLRFYQTFGELSPAFDNSVTDYTYTLPASAEEVRLEAIQENYWAILTYTSNGKTYKPRAPIPVEDGTVIELECAFSEYAGNPPTDTDSLKITIRLAEGASAPDTELSREKFVALLEREATGADVYTATGAMEWGISAGITDGANPESGIDRQQLVTMLYRYAEQAGMSVGNRADLSSYADLNTLAPWAERAMSWAVAEGLVSRSAGNLLMPNAAVSAREAQGMLKKLAS